ncbi:2701_t:CDS:2 [Gigaspora rosea]|nr:2701_t:CDS:2 [Gigaspora rosea]
MTDILVASLPELRHLYLTDNNWEQISPSDTWDLRTVFYIIIEVLDDSQIEEDTIKGQIAKKISRKIDHYWNELQTYFHEAVLLDPSTKFTTFEHSTQRDDALRQIRSTYQTYIPAEENTTLRAKTQTEATSARDYFR